MEFMRKERVREILKRNGYVVTRSPKEYGDVVEIEGGRCLGHLHNPVPRIFKSGLLQRMFHSSGKILLYEHYEGGKELKEVLIREKIPYDVVSPGVF